MSDMAVQNGPVGERLGKEDYVGFREREAVEEGKRGGGWNCQGRICAFVAFG